MPTSKLKIEHWPIGKVLPYANNARLHSPEEITAITKSIAEFGFVNPCLVDADGVLIAGHGRILGAQQIGMKTVPVIQLGYLTEQQARALRIADNQLPALATWDQQLLSLELQELKLQDYDMTLLGFPDAELVSFMAGVGTEGLVDPEEVPEVPKKPVVREGDLWVLGKHRLLCGDATKAQDVSRLLMGDKPNLMVVDPPYGVDYDPDWRNQASRDGTLTHTIGATAIGRVKNDNEKDWTDAWKLFTGNVGYIWHASGFGSIVQESLAKTGLMFRSQIIWNKDRMIIGRGDYHWKHECCFYVVRKGKPGNWQGDRTQTTVWEIAHRASETGHSTQKPIECMKRPIENNSRKGDWIYDPFVGSGTTIIAAEMTARKCLAIEIDPSYAQVSIERWMKFTGQTATLDGKTLEQIKRERHKEAKPKRKKGDVAAALPANILSAG